MQDNGGKGMKVRYADGALRELNAEEIKEIESLAQEAPMPEPTAEERLEALESAMLELMGVVTDG